MNDLPFNTLPPNKRDLERAELGDKFPAEPAEVDVSDELQFYLYPFAKTETKILKVLPTCTAPNFGLTIKVIRSTTVRTSLMLLLNQVQQSCSCL